MIFPLDADYKLTKLIKQGKEKMNPRFEALSHWIDHTINVKTLNIICDRVDKSPRLQICLEYRLDKEKFYGETLYTVNIAKQEAIKQEFNKMPRDDMSINGNWLSKFLNKNRQKFDDVHIYYTAFEPIARYEANQQIPERILEHLKSEIPDDIIWQIVRTNEFATFFLYSDEQVALYSHNGSKEIWTDMYLKLLEPYDEFAILTRITSLLF